MAERVVCPDCGRECDIGQRFCGGCGRGLGATCAACGATNAATSRFCGSCGAALASAVPAGDEERRVVTVLFADLVGFTAQAERLDPEDVRAIQRPYYARLRELLERYGGTVEKYIGDAVMAVFGAPVAHGDDPERAVRAALAIKDAIADATPGLRVRIAVNTGEAIVALGARPTEGEGMVAGDVVNTAARLQAAAPPNGVIVGDATYAATHTAFHYEPVEAVVAKGKDEPVRAWLAVEAVTSPAERAASTAPIVGRAHELDVLRGIWQRVVADERPHLVTVIGPAGVGKTRLAAEFCRVVDDAGMRTIRGRTLPYGESSAYGAFAGVVKQVAGIFDTDPVPLAEEKLAQTAAALLDADAAEVAEQTATLIGVGEGRAAADRQAAFFAARRFVEALARDRPTLLVFEDIHWADPGLLDLLESFAARVRDVPLLLLTLARPELLQTRATWGGGLPAYTALPLEPLTDDEARELVARLFDASGADAARIVETAEGNPLFIEELAASLVEGAAATAQELPTNVRGLIAARLDTLPGAERAVLLDAAVVGKVFWLGALAQLRGGDRALPDLLDSLEQRDLIRRERVSRLQGDQQFVFKHMLIREVAYATLPRAERRERHARVAQFVEQAAGERTPEWATALAHHWHEAGDAERELAYLTLAAERGWPAEAAALYERALELVPEADVDRRRVLRLRRGIAYVEAGDYQSGITALDEVLPHLDARERFEALKARGVAMFWLGDATEARRFGDAAWRVAADLADEDAKALAHAFLTSVDAMEGALDDAIEHGEDALRSLTPEAHPREYAQAAQWTSLQQYWTGRYDSALARARVAYGVAGEVRHVETILSGGSNVGLALTGLGRHEEALEAFQRVVAQGLELEASPRFTGRAMNMWTATLRELHELDEARRLNEQAIELGRRAAFPGAQVSGGIDLLVTDLLEGEVGRAEAAWPALWEAANATKGWHQWLWVGRLRHARAEIELGAGRADAAATAALEALADAQRFGRLKYETASRLTLGRALLAAGRHSAAIESLQAALEIAERLRHPPSIWTAAAAVAHALAATGDDDGAEAALRRSRESLAAFADGLSPERRERFLGAVAQEILDAVR